MPPGPGARRPVGQLGGRGRRRWLGRRGRLAVAVVATVAVGCGGSDPAGVLPDGVGVADGWSVELLDEGLEGPTQLAAPVVVDDTVWVAELAGTEDGGTGRVRRLDLDVDRDAQGGVEPPQLDGLLTPTGVVAVPSDDGVQLLVQAQRELVAVALDGDGAPLVAPVTIGERLPFNGRSQGTLTATPDGRVLHVATGTGSGPDPVDGSGVLYALRPGLDGSDVVAVGFKNAYAHAFGPSGELYVTEIGDGRYDGERPPDELNLVTPDVYERAIRDGAPYDGGWPRCTGDAQPTEEFGATVEECQALPRPLAIFAPGATPTSVVVTSGGRVLVALWVEGRVVEVDPASGEVTDVVTGLDRPQHLLATPDGSVLLAVHGTGGLWRLTPAE